MFKRAIALTACVVTAFLAYSCTAAPGGGSSGGGGSGITYPAGVYVATNGNDTNTGLTKSDPLLTIHFAFSTAYVNNLQTVYVQEGYFMTNAGFDTFIPIAPTASGLTVYGGCDSTFTPQAGHYSVIDAQQARTNIIYMYNISNFNLNGFVITGSLRTGVARLESAMFMTNAKNCVITNCVFTGNSGYYGGALSMTVCDSNIISAIFVSNTSFNLGALLLDGGKNNLFLSSFSNNSSGQNAGGLSLIGYSSSNLITGIFANNTCGTSIGGGNGGGIYINSSGCTNNIVTDCLVINNKANQGAGGGSGGGMLISAPFTKIINCALSNNFASTSGGGIYISGFTNIFVSNCMISSNMITNTASGTGAGIYVVGAINCSIVHSLIINHVCTNSRTGGGLSVMANSFSLVHSTVSNNTASLMGGGCYFSSGGSGYLVSNSLISGNQVTNTGLTGQGGGIFIAGSNSTVFQCMINNNSTPDDDDQGGGLYIIGSNTLVKWCTVSNNASRYGGGIYCGNYSEIYENQIVSNYAYYSGAGVYFTNGIYMLYNNVSANYAIGAGYGAGIYAENAWGTLYINTIGSNLGASFGNGIHIQTSSLTNTQNYFINDGNNISLSANTVAGGLVFNGNYFSGTSTFNNATPIYEIASDTANHTFINNYFVTNRLGTFLYDDYNSTNDVRNNADWSYINLTGYYGATTASGNQVTIW